MGRDDTKQETTIGEVSGSIGGVGALTWFDTVFQSFSSVCTMSDTQLVSLIPVTTWLNIARENLQQNYFVLEGEDPFIKAGSSVIDSFGTPEVLAINKVIPWSGVISLSSTPSIVNVGYLEGSNLLRIVDPDNRTDEGVGILHIVTGGLSVRGREFVPQYALSITGSVGAPLVDNSEVLIRFSDDDGNTWTDMPSISLEEGDFTQEIAWRSLGVIRSPLRIFQIADVSGLKRISDANAEIKGEDDDG